jgi:hypothetical protein
MTDEQFKIGHYGAGTLSLLLNDAGQFILLGSMTIARLSEENGALVSFAPGWRVTAAGGSAIRVQHGDGEGVVVSLERS